MLWLIEVIENTSYLVVLNNETICVIANKNDKAVMMTYKNLAKLPKWIQNSIAILSCAQKNTYVNNYGVNYGNGSYLVEIKGTHKC